MKKFKKALVLFLCAVLLVAGSVMGTLAYLTSQDTVVNTFTVGNVQIKLDEAEVNADGTYKTNHDSRVDGNKYHLLPGHTYIKDPTVTVLANSEECYVRMKVKVTNLINLEAAIPQADNAGFYGAGGVFLLQNLVGDWHSEIWNFEGFTRVGNDGVYEFRYATKLPKVAENTVLNDLFQTITVPGSIDNDHLAYLEGVTITVTAEAIQADGFANADAAWTAFDAE